MVPLLPVELDGARAVVDTEPEEVAHPPNRSHRSAGRRQGSCGWRCRRWRGIAADVLAGGGPVVSGAQGLLDLLRLGEAGAADPAVQVHRRREFGAPRVSAHVAGGELCQGRRGGAQVKVCDAPYEVKRTNK